MARQRTTGEQATGYLILAALVWALGLLAHYEAILIAAPAIWLLAVTMRRTPDRWGLARACGVAALIGGAVLALFYAPFVRHSQFAATYTYLLDRRISGDGFPFNNLADFFTRTTIYSTTYYAFLLIGLAAFFKLADLNDVTIRALLRDDETLEELFLRTVNAEAA